MKTEMKTVFLVDDDTVFLKLLEIEFAQLGEYHIKCFATGELCLASFSEKPDAVILDYHLDGSDRSAMNGIEVLLRIKVLDPEVPVVMLSAQDKIEVAMDCLHHGALDYVVKSETAFLRLKKVLSDVFAVSKMKLTLNWYMSRM